MTYERKTTEWPKRYPFRGKPQSVDEIARIGGIPRQTVYNRMLRGVPVERWADPVMDREEAVRKAGIARGKQIKESRV